MKNKKIKKTKMAWGGIPFNMETPQQAMERYNKNTMMSQLEAQLAAAPYEQLGTMLLNTGLSLAGSGIQQSGGFGKMLGKNGETSKFGAGLDSIFGFKTGEDETFGKLEKILPGATVEKIPTKLNFVETKNGSFGGGKGFGSLKPSKLLQNLNGLEVFATGGTVGSNIPIEAEGGEIMEIPGIGPVELNGPSHENGGIDMNVPLDTEFYSKRIIGADGNTMANRKKLREKKLKKLEKELEKNPNDKTLQKTLNKIKADNDILDQEDLDFMNRIRATKDDIQKFAFGGNVNPLLPYIDFKSILNPKPILPKITGTSDDFHLGYDEIIKPIEKPNKLKYNLPETLELSVINLPSNITKSKESNTNFNINETLKNIASKNPLKGITLGDAIEMYSNYKGAKEMMNNTIRQWEQTPEEINHHANFGKKALNKIQEQYGILEGIKNSALLNSELSRTGTINRNSNATRGINTLRALNLVADAQHDKLASDIMNTYAAQKLNIMDKEAQQLNEIDLRVMNGEMDRADRHLRNQDTFFNNLGRDIATKYQSHKSIGDALNNLKERNIREALINQIYKNFEIDANTGEIKAKTSDDTTFKSEVKPYETVHSLKEFLKNFTPEAKIEQIKAYQKILNVPETGLEEDLIKALKAKDASSTALPSQVKVSTNTKKTNTKRNTKSKVSKKRKR